jgi:hypothetical protein
MVCRQCDIIVRPTVFSDTNSEIPAPLFFNIHVVTRGIRRSSGKKVRQSMERAIQWLPYETFLGTEQLIVLCDLSFARSNSMESLKNKAYKSNPHTARTSRNHHARNIDNFYTINSKKFVHQVSNMSEIRVIFSTYSNMRYVTYST